LLGQLEVRLDGHSAPAPRGLGARLLVMLAVEGDSGCGDERVIDRLWHGHPPRSASFSLRNQITALRRLLGSETIVRGGSGYRFDSTRCTVDVDRFDALVADARAAMGARPADAVRLADAALAVVRGPVLAEVRSESWAVRHVEAIEERVALAEELWAAASLRCGSVARELPRLRSAAEAQPHREIRWQQLIEAATLAGRRTEALRAAHAARQALAGFGLAVGPGILGAEQAALASRAALDVEPRGLPRLLATRVGPFVGRDREMDALAGARRVSLLHGAPGAGKTRLLAEHAGHIRRGGTTVVYVRAEPHADDARFVADLARELLATTERVEVAGELASLLVPDPETPIQVNPALGSAGVRGALGRLLDDAAVGRSVLVMIDDSHRLGTDAWQMLRHLVDATTPKARFVLTAAHIDAAPSGSGWPLLQRDATTVAVGALTQSAVLTLVEHGGVDPATAEAVAADVWAVSSGNALVVIEAIDEYLRTGTCEPGSPRLGPVLVGALGDLGDAARSLLVSLAVIERPVQATVAGAAVDLHDGALVRAVDVLTSRRIVEVDDHGRLIVCAYGYLALARASVSRADHRRIRRRVADHPTAREGDAALMFRTVVALAPLDAGDASLLDEVFVRVAADLLAAGALSAAVDSAVEYVRVAGSGHTAFESVRAHLVAATLLLSSSGTAAQGRALLDVVFERAHLLDDPELLADAVLARGPVETGGSRSRRTADEAARLAGLVAPDDVPRRVQLLCWAAHHRLNVGDRDAAMALIEAASTIAIMSAEPRWRGLVLSVTAQAEQSLGGSPAGARRAHADLQRWVTLTGDVGADAGARLTSVGLAFGVGTLDDVEQAQRCLAEISVVMPRPDLCWLPTAIEAAVLLARGERATAPAAVEAAAAIGRELGVAGADATAVAQRMLVMMSNGTFGSLATLLGSAFDPQRTRNEVMATYGFACALVGEMATARMVAQTLAARPALLKPAGISWPVVAMAASELAFATGDVVLGSRVCDELSGWSGWGLSLYGVAYFGAADTWLGLAAAAMGRDRMAAELLRSAIAQEERRGALPWRDRALSALADLRVQAGRLH
jgi:DNA-binding SARP family transcriptional activator